MARAAFAVDRSDLEKLEKSLRRYAVRLPDEGEKVLEDTAADVATDSRSRLQGRPGSRGSYKRMPELIDATQNRRLHSIVIEAGGTAIGAEYGTTFHWVFGRRVNAKSMKRRVFGARVKRWRSGKVVGKAVKADLPHAERRLALAFDKLAEREFRRAGL